MKYILVVEDDLELNRGLCTALKSEDRKMISCNSLKETREQIELFLPTLVLLDVNLPDGNGFDLLKELKEKYPKLPVIMLTANDTDRDIVNGLEQGADDYITKPFSLSVLRARVNTQLKRLEDVVNEKQDVYLRDKYCFDFEKMIFKVDGQEVSLSKTEMRLLYILVKNENHVVGRESFMEKIWTDGSEYVDENALSVAVKRLRNKLSAGDYIKTIYGIGYKWSAEGEKES